MTQLFNRMLAKEAARTFGQDVWVKEALTNPPTVNEDSQSFPILHEGCTEEDYEMMKKICTLEQEGVAVVRYEPMPDDVAHAASNPGDDHDADFTNDMSFEITEDGEMEGEIKHCQAASSLIGAVNAATQREQVETAQLLADGWDA